MADFYEQWKELSEKINEEVPIENVLGMYGITPNRSGKYKLRENDDTPSASVNRTKIGNRVHDFGAGNTFSCCSFVAWREGVSYKEATKILADSFGYELPSREPSKGSDTLSDREWGILNIYPDMASKNMSFFPEKYGVERTRIYAEKYRMSMSELKELAVNELQAENHSSPEFLPAYERIVYSKGVAHVMDLKSSYYASLYNWYNFNKALGAELAVEELLKDPSFSNASKQLSLAENVLMKAAKGTSIVYKSGTYNVEKDFQKVVNGDVEFDIGQNSKYDIKNNAYRVGAKVFECLVSLDEYYKLVENGLDNIEYAAKQKGEAVKLFFVSTDSSRVNFLVRALLGKEIGVDAKANDNRILDQESSNEKVFSQPAEAFSGKKGLKEDLSIQ